MVLLPQWTQQEQDPQPLNTHIPIGFFELPVVLAAQALLLPRVQDQAGGIASVPSRGEARVAIEPTNGVEIEMLEMPVSDRLRRDGLQEQ